MEKHYQSLAHSSWNCKYPIGFVPKRRRRQLYGEIRRQLGAIFPALARQKECQIVEGHLMADHVHMCIAIPPKHAVAQVIGFLKGKSASAIARQFGGKERNFTGEHCWARGSAVSTVGFELAQVRAVHSPSRRRGPRRGGLLLSSPAGELRGTNSGDRL